MCNTIPINIIIFFVVQMAIRMMSLAVVLLMLVARCHPSRTKRDHETVKTSFQRCDVRGSVASHGGCEVRPKMCQLLRRYVTN